MENTLPKYTKGLMYTVKHPIIASYSISNSFGLVMYEISDERVTVAWSDELEKTHTRKLYRTERGAYFILNGVRFYLDEFVRV